MAGSRRDPEPFSPYHNILFGASQPSASQLSRPAAAPLNDSRCTPDAMDGDPCLSESVRLLARYVRSPRHQPAACRPGNADLVLTCARCVSVMRRSVRIRDDMDALRTCLGRVRGLTQTCKAYDRSLPIPHLPAVGANCSSCSNLGIRDLRSNACTRRVQSLKVRGARCALWFFRVRSPTARSNFQVVFLHLVSDCQEVGLHLNQCTARLVK